MPWFLYYALKQLFPNKKKISFFSLISIIGVSLGVCILLVVQGVMNGFGDNIRKQLTKYDGEVRLYSYSGIAHWETVIDHLSLDPDIKGLAPYVDSPSLVQSDSASAFTLMRGIDLNSFMHVFSFEDCDVVGLRSELDDYSVLMGAGLAQSLNVSVGQSISVFSPNFIENMKEDEVLLPLEFTVKALIKTGSPNLDKQLLLGTIRSVQDLSERGNTISGINVRLEPRVDLDQKQGEISETIASLDAGIYLSTWRDLNKDLLFVVEQEKNIISFIIVFIIIVASFSIAVALTLSVVRKTKEIGLLCALGAKSWQILLSFCLQGFIIGFIGSILGMLLSWLCLENRQLILELYTWLTNSDTSIIGVYDIYSIPVRYIQSDYWNIFALTLFIAFGASIIPAIKASRLNPAEALRND